VSKTPKTDAAKAKFDKASDDFVYRNGSFDAAFKASVELTRARREEGVPDPFEGRKF
jgi:hypothetical protein